MTLKSNEYRSQKSGPGVLLDRQNGAKSKKKILKIKLLKIWVQLNFNLGDNSPLCHRWTRIQGIA
jgi:hypothetical protein